MLEDKMLFWQLRNGHSDALRRIYVKYSNELLALAICLSDDKTLAEDVVHDVFVSFAERAKQIRLKSSLKGYLLTCTANRVRSLQRTQPKQRVSLEYVDIFLAETNLPDSGLMSAELSEKIANAIAQLPYEQKETLVLHLLSGCKFRELAKSQNVSINTIQSRYRYGLEKLRFLLNGEVGK